VIGIQTVTSESYVENDVKVQGNGIYFFHIQYNNTRKNGTKYDQK